MKRSDLIKQIDRCSAVTGLKPSTICQSALGNSKTYKALVEGKPGPGIDGIEKLVSWMDLKIAEATAQQDDAA